MRLDRYHESTIFTGFRAWIAVNSDGRFVSLHTAGATGSIPVPPTIQKRRRNKDLGSFLGRCCFLNGCFLSSLGQFWDSAGGASSETPTRRSVLWRPSRNAANSGE